MTNWRRAFLDRALKAVCEAYNNYKTAHPNATKGDMAKWATDASDTRTGAAYWQTPVSKSVCILCFVLEPSMHDSSDTMQNGKPRGLLRSSFILDVFAPHFKAISASRFKQSDPPVGALSLACAAVCVTSSMLCECHV